MTLEKIGIFKKGLHGESYELCNDSHRWLWRSAATGTMHDPKKDEPDMVTISQGPSGNFSEAVTLSPAAAQTLWVKLHVGENLDPFQTFEF